MSSTQPLLAPLAGAPADRPTRRRRLLFLAGVTAAVLTALSAVILLSSAHARRSALAGAAYEVRFLVVSPGARLVNRTACGAGQGGWSDPHPTRPAGRWATGGARAARTRPRWQVGALRRGSACCARSSCANCAAPPQHLPADLAAARRRPPTKPPHPTTPAPRSLRCGPAAAMARLAERWPVDFVVSTGDNFYKSGLKGVDDPAFDSTFTNVYSMQSLQVGGVRSAPLWARGCELLEGPGACCRQRVRPAAASRLPLRLAGGCTWVQQAAGHSRHPRPPPLPQVPWHAVLGNHGAMGGRVAAMLARFPGPSSTCCLLQRSPRAGDTARLPACRPGSAQQRNEA